ncbi:MAG: ATP synthase F0 subunit C [Candidatus Paceibacterota bacterium]
MENTATQMVTEVANSDVESMRLIAKGMVMTIAMAGSALGEGFLLGKGLEAIGRNPEIESSIFTKMIISVALVESTAIYAFVAFFLL